MDNGSEPATKQDIAAVRADMTAMRADLTADMAALEERLTERLTKAFKEAISEAIHDSETRLLTAFYAFAQTNEKRLEAFESSTSNLRDRIAIVESRLIQVEKRLNMPPAA